MNFESFVEGLMRAARRQPSPDPDDLLVVPDVPSTNLFARAMAEGFQRETETLPALLVLAFGQSGGRGRLGRSWSSPAGKGVYATRVVGTDDPSLLQRLPILTGVGLCRGLARLIDLPLRLKWPNDLVIEVEGRRRKLGGVLIEAWSAGEAGSGACIGFGVNVSHASGELPDAGISLHGLAAALGRPELTEVDLAEAAWALAQGLEDELRKLAAPEEEQIARYRELSVHRPGEEMTCVVGDRRLVGRFAGFDAAGRLRLSTPSGEEVLAAGEVIES